MWPTVWPTTDSLMSECHYCQSITVFMITPFAYLSFLFSPLVSSLPIPWEQMYKHCVIIQKDEKGYGLRVSGESPVFVESVRPGQCAPHLCPHWPKR